MRVYLWDYNSWQDVPDHLRNKTLTLINDEKSILKCGYCQTEFVDNDTIQYCPNCHMNLVFGRFNW